MIQSREWNNDVCVLLDYLMYFMDSYIINTYGDIHYVCSKKHNEASFNEDAILLLRILMIFTKH